MIKLVLIGENGAVIQFGVDLPPRRFEILPYEKVALTPFPKTEEEFTWIQDYIDENREALPGLDVYRHCDSFDIVPKGLDKKKGLEYLEFLLKMLKD